MNKTAKKLYSLYQTHGALTFMLAFYPILPNVVELHAKAYLKLIKGLTGSVEDMDQAIRVVFGARGLKAYEEYKRDNRAKILPSQVFNELFVRKNPTKGLKLIQEMFFDKNQRSLENSDKFRAAVILTIPDILIEYEGDGHAEFRMKLISMLANEAIIDQALPSQLAFVETALHLLAQAQNVRDQKHERQLRVIYKSIEAKIKAELAGKSSAYTAPIVSSITDERDKILLTEADEHNLKEVLLLLSLGQAPEVNEKAKEALKAIEVHLN